MIQEIINKPFEIKLEEMGNINPFSFNFRKEENLKHLFYEMVYKPIRDRCNLVNIEFSFNYIKREFTNTLQISLFYSEIFSGNSESDILSETFAKQQLFACKCLQRYYDVIVFGFFGEYSKNYLENLQKKEDNIKGFDNSRYEGIFRITNQNFNTAYFYGGDNFDGFIITDTEE